ncbi:hypothetical protein TYRP_013910, partial [Tyrophagus putrescentiae]
LTASVEESYLEAVDRFRMTIGNLRLAKANNNNNNNQQRALPKERALEHDGSTSSFFGFWKRAEESILELDIDDAAKLRALRAAVHPSDANSIALLDTVNEVKEYLQEKYTSEAAVRSLMNERMRSIRIQNEFDAAGIRKLKEVTGELYAIIQQTDFEDSLERDMFDMLYGRLPREIRTYLMEKTDGKRELENVEKILAKKADLMLSDELASGNHQHQQQQQFRGSQRGSGRLSGERSAEAREGRCFFCRGGDHLVAHCQKLKDNICTKCDKKGHTPKFCTNRQVKMYGCVGEKLRKIGSVWREMKPRCEVVVGKQQFEAIVDTGSDATILPLKTAPAKTPSTNLTMADGQSQMTAHGPAEVTLTVAGKRLQHSAYFADIEPIITETTTEELGKLVREEFSDLLTGLGKTDLVEHSIDTGNNRPIAIRGRRIPAHHVEAVGRHVQELLQTDVIEEAESD